MSVIYGKRKFMIVAYYKGNKLDLGEFEAESAIAAMIDARRANAARAASYFHCSVGQVNFEIEEYFL